MSIMLTHYLQILPECGNLTLSVTDGLGGSHLSCRASECVESFLYRS